MLVFPSSKQEYWANGMQNSDNVSRRSFLQLAGALSASSYLRLTGAALASIAQSAYAADQDDRAFLALSADEARDFAAMAARIIPTTDTPGATEAGVIHFFDNAFAEDMSGDLGHARAGLAEFNAALAASGHSGRFDQLGANAQDDFLRSQESGDFFGLVREMTIFGFFAMSSYGGNKDHVGWDLIGFEGHHGVWTYPFGHYDAEYAKETSRGE
jgi:gluconate 2-dehydrogenase gamma chain